MRQQHPQRFQAAGDRKKKEIAKNQSVKNNPRKETFILHRG
jgi:hypothetical protein